MTGAPRAKRRPAKARSAPAEPPAPKHRTDEEERAAHSEAGARGRKVNGVKALCAGFSYEQVPYWLSARVYLIHIMPDISRSRDAPSPWQSRGPIGPRGRSLQLQRRQKSAALLSKYVVSTIVFGWRNIRATSASTEVLRTIFCSQASVWRPVEFARTHPVLRPPNAYESIAL